MKIKTLIERLIKKNNKQLQLYAYRNMKLKTLIERLIKKNNKQLQLYAYRNMKLKKEDLIYHLEEDEDIKIDRKLTYLQIVSQYRVEVIILITELWENCD